MIAFAVAAALSALGGALFAPTVPFSLQPPTLRSINGFAAAVFGGLGSIRLALIGGYALGIMEQLVVGYVDPQYGHLTIALVAMLILIGWRSRAELCGLNTVGASGTEPCAGWLGRGGLRRFSPRPYSPAGFRSSSRNSMSGSTTEWGCIRSSRWG